MYRGDLWLIQDNEQLLPDWTQPERRKVQLQQNTFMIIIQESIEKLRHGILQSLHGPVPSSQCIERGKSRLVPHRDQSGSSRKIGTCKQLGIIQGGSPNLTILIQRIHPRDSLMEGTVRIHRV
jgi:hypothetical protein